MADRADRPVAGRWPTLAALSLLVSGLLCGCTSDGSVAGVAGVAGGGAGPSGTTAITTATSTSTSTESGATPASGPTPSRTPPPAAANKMVARNGTDVKACRDARCEIVVRGRKDIPLAAKFGFSRFTITHVRPATTRFDGQDQANGDLHGAITGTGTLSANGITIVVVAVTKSGSLLRFSPRK